MDWDLFTNESVKGVDKAFPAIGDFHGANSIAFYGYEPMQKLYFNDYKLYKDRYRDASKRVGLALLYGGSYKVVEAPSEAEQRRLYANFFSTLKGFKKHLQDVEAHSRKNLYTSNFFGMRVWLKDINHKDFRIASAVKRRMYNYPIQSSGVDIILMSMYKIIKFSEKTDTNKFANDNIHKKYYNRIVVIDEAIAGSPELLAELEATKEGNIALAVAKNGEIIKVWDKYLAIDTDFIAKYKAEVLI